MLGLDRLPKNIQDNIAYILVGISIFAILFLGIIMPQNNSIKENKKLLSAKKKEIVEIEKLVEEYKSLPVVLSSSNSGKSLLARVDSISTELSLKKRMGQIKSLSSKKNKEGADVRFDLLNIKEITDLILTLKRDKIKIVRARLRDNDIDGLWNLSLILEG